MFFKELETEKVLLKNIGYDDAEFMPKHFSNNDVNKYLFDAEPMATIEEAIELVDFYCEDESRNQHRWILVRKEDGQKIGTCWFHRWDREAGSVEIGYDLQPAFWRKGYMGACLEVILEFAKREMGVKRINAHIAEGNTASEKLSEKYGFIRTESSYYEEFHGKKYLHNIYELKIDSR